MVKRVARRASSSGSGGAAGVETVQAGTDITIDNADPQNPVVNANVPVKSFTEGENMTITDLGGGDYRFSSFQPLNEPAVQRIASGLTLPAQVANIIVSAATATDITITLPVASDYPVVSNKLFETRIANQSNFDVTVVIADGSNFVDSADKIVLKAGQKDTILLRAFNFPVDGVLPAADGWSLADKVLVTFYAQYAGNVDIDDFNSPGQAIAFREGTETDNDSVFELNNANETEIFVKTDCTATITYSSEIDSTQISTVWNVDNWVQIERGATTIIPDRGRTRTGNFGREDAFVSQQINIKLLAGDVVSIYMLNNNCNGNHKAATVNFDARV